MLSARISLLVLPVLVACSSDGGTNGSTSSVDGGATTTAPADAIDPVYVPLFGAPSGPATPGTIFGLWGGKVDSTSGTKAVFDTRVRLSANEVIFATKCEVGGKELGLVGVTGAARVSETEFTVLESKTAERKVEGYTCRAFISPGQVPACKSDQFATKENCFVLTGTRLEIYGDSGLNPAETLTKISD